MLSEANFIEGIGDEVLVLLGICVLLLAIFLVWMSTQVHWDNRPIRVFVFRSASVTQETATTEEVSLHSVDEASAALPEDMPPESEGVHQRNRPQQSTEEPGQPPAVIPTANVLLTPATAVAAAADTIDEAEPVGSLILRLKYFDERQKVVSANPSESILNFKKRCFHQELSENKNVRLIFNGRELKEGQFLHSYGLTDEATIHCLITRRAPGDDGSGQTSAAAGGGAGGVDSQSDEMDISGLMFPIFGILLSLIWYCRVSYRQYFNVLSTFALVGITVLFFVAAFTCWTYRVRQQEFLRSENNTRAQNTHVPR